VQRVVQAAAAARRGEQVDADDAMEEDAEGGEAEAAEAEEAEGTAPAAGDAEAVATCAEAAAQCRRALEDGVERALAALGQGETLPPPVSPTGDSGHTGVRGAVGLGYRFTV
jgi:hypothetical protein